MGTYENALKMVTPSLHLKSPTLTFTFFKKSTNFIIINGEEQNSFTMVRYGTLIMSRNGNETLNLRRSRKESETLDFDTE